MHLCYKAKQMENFNQQLSAKTVFLKIVKLTAMKTIVHAMLCIADETEQDEKSQEERNPEEEENDSSSFQTSSVSGSISQIFFRNTVKF